MQRFLLALIGVVSIIGALAQNCTIVSTDIVCKEELMSFDVTASAGINSVIWDMGDATTSTQKNFSHKYSTAGLKTIKAILSLNGGGTCTASKQITVFELPQFKARLKPDNIYCLSQNKVCFIDSSYGGDAGINLKKRIVLWDDGDQTTTPKPAMGGTVCHTYAYAGTFKVTIELTNDKDCKAIKEIEIKVLPDVVPVFTLSGGKICDSANVLMLDLTSKDTSEIVSRLYTWGDGQTTLTKNRKAVHIYSASGYYRVGLTLIQKNGCRTSKDTLIQILIPEIKFNIVKDAYRKCLGQYFRLEQKDNLIGAYYLWTYGGKQSSGKVLNILPGLGKTYFELQITYAGCTKTFRYDSIEVVGIAPSIKVFNANQCSNKDTVYFCETDVRYGSKNVTFFWNFGDNGATPCTTSYKNKINVKSNCNYSTDSLAKHFYVNGKCKVWKLSIKDADYGCNRDVEGIINTVKPDTFQFRYIAKRLCLGLKPDYKILFDKTICPSIRVEINLDSACGRKNFIPFTPYHFYQKTCNANGWVTVGFVIKYGDKKVYRNWCDDSDFYIDPSRECTDTIWYHHWFKLMREPFAPFEISGNCIPAKVKPTLLDPYQKNMAFSTWDWGDNSKIDTVFFKSNAPVLVVPTHTYKKAGSYKVNFYLENSNGCYATDMQILNLGYDVGMRFDTVICPGLNVTFFDSIFYRNNSTEYWHDAARKAQGKESFKWDFDDGRGFVTDTANPMITFPAIGRYRIRLATKDSSNCLDTLSRIITVGGVVAGIKKITKEIICDDIIQFFDSSSTYFKPPADSIVKFFWEFGDKRNPSYLKNPFHYYKNYGNFTIIHKVENTRGCRDSTSISITIDGPEPKFDIVTDTVGCAPYTAEFKNTSTKTRDFIWYFGDKLKTKLSTNRDTNVRFTYTQPGIYYIYLFGSDSVINPNTDSSIHYCSATFPDSTDIKPVVRRIVVLPIPKADFTVDSVICAGKPIGVTNLSDGIYKRYKWTIKNRDSLETNQNSGVLNTKDTGLIKIKFTPFYIPFGPYQRRCFDTIIKTVRLSTVKADINFVRDSLCSMYTFRNTSKGYTSLRWDMGHAASGVENNIRYDSVVTHNYAPDTGIFYPCLYLENNYGCKDTLCIAIRSDFSPKLIIPNVFTPGADDLKNDVFDILGEGLEEYKLSIFNRWGQKLFETTIDGIGNDGYNWRGRPNSNGKLYPDGTYFYLLDYKFKCDDKKYKAHGMITLIGTTEE